MNASAPIGVFDSGVGGLSVLKEIRQRLPNESLIYFADSAYAPYGEKSAQTIIERSHYCCDWLIERGAKALVVACNTATAAAVHSLRESYSIPVIAMEPAVKPAAKLSKRGIVGVLATSGTLKSEKFAALQKQHACGVDVITQPCPGLVEAIEKGEPNSSELLNLLKRYVGVLVEQNVDVIVLGCTHYPLVRQQIEMLLPAGIHVIDSGAAVAQRVQSQLEQFELSSQASNNEAVLTLATSGKGNALEQVVQQVLGVKRIHAIVEATR